MTLILVAEAGGRPHVIAAGMAAAASARGARVNLGAIQEPDVEPADFAATISALADAFELVIVFFEPAVSQPAYVYSICEAAEDADLDLVLHLACSPSTDDAVEMVDALREIGIEPSGLVLDQAPTDDAKYKEARSFLAAAAGVPVVGALPAGAEAMQPDEFARAAVSWFDEDETYDD